MLHFALSSLYFPLGLWAIFVGANILHRQPRQDPFLLTLGVLTIANAFLAFSPFPPEPLATPPAILFSLIKLHADLPLAALWLWFALKTYGSPRR